MTGHTASRVITFEELADLREKTERLSQFLTQRLKSHIATLSPILEARRVFGKYVGAKESLPRADEAYRQLTQAYREISGDPFDLRSDLADEALTHMGYGIDVYPWEYTHEAQGKGIRMTSPVRWIISYRSEYSLSEMRTIVSGTGERRPLSVGRFVVNALSMQIVLARNPGAAQLLEDLRYDVKVETGPGLGKLPLVTIGSRIQSFRPADDLILAATRLSGVPAFIELIDPEVVYHLQDPLRTQLEGILGSNS